MSKAIDQAIIKLGKGENESLELSIEFVKCEICEALEIAADECPHGKWIYVKDGLKVPLTD